MSDMNQMEDKPSYEYPAPVPRRMEIEKMIFHNKYFWYFGWWLFLYFIIIGLYGYNIFINQDIPMTIKVIYFLLLFIASLLLVKSVNSEFNTIKSFFVIYNYLFNQWKEFANSWLSSKELKNRTKTVNIVNLQQGYKRKTPRDLKIFKN